MSASRDVKETFLLEGFPISSPRGYLGWANVLLLEDEGTQIVVDTGAVGDRGLLLQRMHAVGLHPEGVAFVILTHLHFDHCLNLDLFPQATVVLGGREREYVASGLYRRSGDNAVPPFILSLLEERNLTLVDDGLEVSTHVSVVATPGHTPGSVSVLYTAEGVRTIACADLVKNGWEFLNGPPTADARATLARVRPLATRWVPGHDRPFLVVGASIRYEGTREVELQALLAATQEPAVTKWRFE